MSNSVFFSDSTSGTLTIGTTGSGNIAIGTTSSGIGIYNSSASCFLTSTHSQKRNYKADNLAQRYPPSENTRIHRKRVRVTDLARPSVYILYFYDEVVYVGQSVNAYQRMSQHLRDKDFTHIRVMSCRKERMNYWEQKLIDALAPELNITHNKRRRGKRKLRLIK
jgi:predicted GIY-YIG superfamily endonuclease